MDSTKLSKLEDSFGSIFKSDDDKKMTKHSEIWYAKNSYGYVE